MNYKSVLFVFLMLLVSFFSNAQIKTTAFEERFPVFDTCKDLLNNELEDCFYNEIQQNIFSNFKVPEKYQNNFKGEIKVLFEVDVNGVFNIIYVNAIDEELVKEVKVVFGKFPKIQPPTFNGKPTYSRYTIAIQIPLLSPEAIKAFSKTSNGLEMISKKKPTELESLVYKKYNSPELKSNLNIPFSHSYYSQFDASMNQVGSNNHTASKPYTYTEVAKYYDLEEANKKLQKNVSSWWARKLWNENLVAIQGEDYWIDLNPILDLQVGKDLGSTNAYTYVNTRAVNVRGGIGKQINFTSTIFESQGLFADYYNRYARTLKPSGGSPAIIPGIGIAKEFKTNSFDFPMAEANLTFTANNHIDVQLGYGRNFIGDGYRSLLEGDGTSPYPYLKLNTKFWKIKYTNTFMSLKDVRPDATIDKTYTTKYMANHYLSWNMSNRINIGFFESVIWADTNNRGFDASFMNPLIFYRSVEFASSSKSGNALLGLTFKYKYNNSLNLYGQFLLDEFSLKDIREVEGSWKNKFGYQLGAKYYNAFKVENLLLQLEYNYVRPYTYSHSNPVTNYGHNNQSFGHQWGGNMSEIVAIARYQKGRYYSDFKLNMGVRGLDFNTTANSFNYGGDIYKSYETDRPFDKGVVVGQGNTAKIVIADFQAGYLVNPATNLKLFGSYIYRSFIPKENTASVFNETTNWFSIGLRADVFNWYFDY